MRTYEYTFIFENGTQGRYETDKELLRADMLKLAKGYGRPIVGVQCKVLVETSKSVSKKMLERIKRETSREVIPAI